MPASDELLELSLTEAARLVRARHVSPVELVEASLARIATADARLRAFISVFVEQARQVARAMELLITAGQTLGPLHGIPIEAAEPSAYHQQWLRSRPQEYGEDVRILLEAGELLPATHYLQAQRYRSALRSDFMAAFKKVDVFIGPTLAFTATPVGATTVIIENGQPEDMLAAIMRFTGIPSLTGLPALSVPCGFDTDGLPIGMQIMGKPFAENYLFGIAAAYQDATDFHLRAPCFERCAAEEMYR